MTGLEIFAIILALVGIVGSIVPGLPGPPLSWIGMLLVYFAKSVGPSGAPMTTTYLFVWLAIVSVITVVDYLLPAWMTRLTGGHKAASVGAIVGLFAGLLVPPVGMILGSLLGAFVAELFVADNGVWNAFKASIGAFLGFILTTGMKLICSGIMCYYIFRFVF